jgi:hypothetical protein
METATPDIKLQKKRIRKGKQPLFTYKVLKIKIPGSSKRNSKTGKTKPLNYNRIHLCRGHFKTYTAERPLLGRFTGTYWWQPAVRGNAEKGVVEKEYEVTTTQPTQGEAL